ncbi:putative Heterokaryon incompatibility protein-domain-containing protein [Seiridium cardinale]|uniref:Heterokaryon incompatibility protein-domain-containing protein n=1 Tax=Seiridium cardinale TaxID=138064 RepID=A0ABR2XLN9_9PEZI
MELMELDPTIAAALYKPLREAEIRLAKLEPGEGQTPITVSLVTVGINQHPAYDAISYVWACMGNAMDGRARDVASLLADYGPILARPRGTTDLLQLWRMGATPDKDSRWSAIRAVMAAPWFERAWVLQEVGLANNPRVLYGPVEFGYRDLMATVRCIRIFAGDFALKAGIGAFLIHTNWVDWSDEWAETPAYRRYKFVDLLDHGALLNCQDPRDRVFAFLSHPLARRISTIVPDYTKTKPQVFQEATVTLLQDAGIRALSSVEHDSSTLYEDFPTWVIRWDIGFTLNNIAVYPSSQFRADMGLLNPFQIDGNVLRLKGIAVDIVEAAFEVGLLAESMKIVFRRTHIGSHHTILDVLRFLENPEMPSGYASSRSESFAHTLCCESNSTETASLRGIWAEYFNSQKSPPQQCDRGKAHSFWTKIAGGCRGRAFVVTKGGLYGLAPRIVAQGDLCCVIYGSAVPFMMRPVLSTAGVEHVRLIGETYLHGMMQGEAAKLASEDKMRECVFAVV